MDSFPMLSFPPDPSLLCLPSPISQSCSRCGSPSLVDPLLPCDLCSILDPPSPASSLLDDLLDDPLSDQGDPDAGLLDLLAPAPIIAAVSPLSSAACSTEGGARWDADARHRHSRACSGKTRLSPQDKLDIISLYYLADAASSSRRTVHQWDIARKYGKSRAAISKLLKPEQARRVLGGAEGRVKSKGKILKRIREEEARRGYQSIGRPVK